MILSRLILLLYLLPVLLLAETSLPPYSLAYDASRDPFEDGRAAIRLAQQTQRRVLIEVGGDWCTWCHKLDAFLANTPAVQRQLHRHFVILKVNVSDENDNRAFMQGLPKALGYPHMYVSDTDGRILLSKDTAEFLQNKRYSASRFLQFIDQWKAP